MSTQFLKCSFSLAILALVTIAAGHKAAIALPASNEPAIENPAIEEPINQNSSHPVPNPSPGESVGFSDSTKSLLQQQGLSFDIGQTMRVEGCETSLFGGWGAGGKTNECKWPLPKQMEEQGWVIIGSEVTVTKKEGKSHRSGYTKTFEGSNSAYSFTSSSIDKVQAALKAAIDAKDAKAQVELNALLDRMQSYSTSSSSTHNIAVLRIWTQSGVATRAGITAGLSVLLVKGR